MAIAAPCALVIAGLCACVDGVVAPWAPEFTAPTSIGALALLGSKNVVRTAGGPLAHFGGISGIDRDTRTGEWLLLSDDRSALAPARFYPAQIEIDSAGIRGIRIGTPVALLQSDGTPYPGRAQGGDVPDPESLRIDPGNGRVSWSSEGDRGLGLDPFVRSATRDGRAAGSVRLPSMLRVHADREQGVRNNQAIEGLSFTPDAKALWVSLESPLYEDGDVPTAEHGALARFTLLPRNAGAVAQYAYPLDAIPPLPDRNGLADNGVSEILCLASGHLLVIERAGYEFAPGAFRFAVRIYEAEIDGATEISGLPSLREASVRPMRKRLLLDLSKLELKSGDRVDNIEGAAWGPRLPNGHATLLLASDDNFSTSQSNQFIAFEVIP